MSKDGDVVSGCFQGNGSLEEHEDDRRLWICISSCPVASPLPHPRSFRGCSSLVFPRAGAEKGLLPFAPSWLTCAPAEAVKGHI